ncbi:hypothetical protein BU25DRAFT_75954 [Macroventuria anomochaeta]|uniref:Uncharacterized protein n=1 Tax=Macroventuria anomochaeta TaxID=301207 RepID=A0ACB6RZX9_9PLEO|nr:uncharacterized protein BU25DRAFT_75954 [Macroventuria anomochaeta]KAF2626965.1 hypothetical protein BU25DRAFT_75954 [Macroventuria anomochaeta]
MKTSKSPLCLAFLLINAVVAEAGVDLHSSNVGQEVSGRKIENLISGVDRSTNSVAELDISAINDVRRSANANTLDNADLVNKIAQLDIGSLLNAGAQGQGASQGQSQGQSQQQGQGQAQPQGQSQGLKPVGPSDINTSNVGADLANQVAAGNRPTVGTGDINTSNVGADLANQVAGFGTTPAAQGQAPDQAPGAGQAQPAPQAQAAKAPRPAAESQPVAEARPSTGAQAAAEAQPSRQGQSQGTRPAGPSDITTSNIAGDLANQLAPGSGVNGQRPASNDVAGDLANQIAGGGVAPIGQGQSSPQGQGQVAAAQSGGAGAAIIEVKSTILQEANGQQIATAVIEQQRQGQQPAAAPAPTEAPAITTPQALAAPAEAKPTEAPAAMPVSAEPQSKSTAVEAAAKPETQPTQPPAEGMSAMVGK